MDKILEFFKGIWSLNTDQIAIISLVVTLLIFAIGRFSENRIKRYETRKEEYQNLINFFIKMLANVNNNKIEELSKDDEFKETFIKTGASLAIFGSKKLYSTYVFFRTLSLDTRVQNSKYYSPDMLIYSLAEMYKIMRKEIGLNSDLFPFGASDMLSFYLTDFTKPDYKKKYYRYHFNKLVIKSAIFWGKIEDCIPFYWLQNFIIKPFFFLCFCIIRLPIKLLIITPFKLIKNRNK